MNGHVTGDNQTLRLSGNPTEKAAVEIYDGFTWWSICTRDWNLEASNIVCRYFGYEFALGALKIPVVAEATQSKMLQFRCKSGNAGYESLLQCNTDTNAACLCSKQKAGIICSKGKIIMWLSHEH